MDWQDATIDTIRRFQAVLAINPTLTPERRSALYAEARAVTSQLNPGPQRYWNIFLNVLRIFIAAESGVEPKKSGLFDAAPEKTTGPRERVQCPEYKKMANGRARCEKEAGHEGRCLFI